MKAPEDLFHYTTPEDEYIFQEIFGYSCSLYQKSKDSGPVYASWDVFAKEFFAQANWYTAQPKFVDKSLFLSVLEQINLFKKEKGSTLSFAEHQQLYAWEMAIYDGGNNTPEQFCGNCAAKVGYFARYPKSICRSCNSLLTDEKGQKVDYHNTAALGYGVQGIYVESREKYNSLDCFIGQQKFRAAEHRFGGIVVQRVDD